MKRSDTKLWKHQEEGIKEALQSENYAFFWEMGTGKTRAIIEVLKAKFKEKGRVRNTVIFSPISTLGNWRDEFVKYADIDPRHIILFDKSSKKCILEFADRIKNYPHKIVVMNYEKIINDEIYSSLVGWLPEIIVCDESQRIKSHTSKRSKKVQSLAAWARHRYLLSGTPITNSALDIFQQFRVLDDGKTFGKNFFAFRGSYFYDKNAAWSHQSRHFPSWEPKPDTYEKFNSLIQQKAMVVKKDQCLDLPPLVKQKLIVELGSEQRKAYQEMKADFITFVEQSKTDEGDLVASVATQAITKALRLQQISSGFIKLEDDRIIRFKKNDRLVLLKELLEELTPNNKVIVWACFKENYTMIKEVCDQLGIKYAEVHGEITKKQEQIDKFRNEEDCRVFIGNQQAAGVGINLIEAGYSIFYSKNFSLEADLQAEARNYRGGSEMHEKVTRIDLVAKGTIDELVNESLERKENIGVRILENPQIL